MTVFGTLKNTLGPHHNNPSLGTAWPGMFQKGAAGGYPPGSAYSVVGYGLFDDFKLMHADREIGCAGTERPGPGSRPPLSVPPLLESHRRGKSLGLSLWLSIIVITVSAAFAVAGAYQKSRFTHYAFKPLTMILIMSLAWDKANDASQAYGYLILAGLCLGLVGDIALMLPGTWFRQGMAAFGAGHIFYTFAFALGTKECSVCPRSRPLAPGEPSSISCFAPGLDDFELPVSAYMAHLSPDGLAGRGPSPDP